MEARRWSPQDVSTESRKHGAGISKQGVYDLLNPLRKRIGMDAITALCNAFQCEPGDLFIVSGGEK